jgi:hypothetical protein
MAPQIAPAVGVSQRAPVENRKMRKMRFPLRSTRKNRKPQSTVGQHKRTFVGILPTKRPPSSVLGARGMSVFWTLERTQCPFFSLRESKARPAFRVRGEKAVRSARATPFSSAPATVAHAHTCKSQRAASATRGHMRRLRDGPSSSASRRKRSIVAKPRRRRPLAH